MMQTPTRLIYVVVIAICVLALVGVGSLCASLFLHTYADPAILTAIITITGGLVGSLTTILASPRTQHPDSSTTQTTTTVTTATPPPSTPLQPTSVVIENPPEHPANVTVQPTP